MHSSARKVCAGWQESLKLGGNRISAKFALFKSEEATKQKKGNSRICTVQNTRALYVRTQIQTHGDRVLIGAPFVHLLQETKKQKRRKQVGKTETMFLFFGLVMLMETS